MYSFHFKIEHFFLISLFVWFFVGISNFLNLILILQIVSIFFFLNYKINYIKFFLTILLSIFILYSSDYIDAFKVYIIFIFLILSFDYDFKRQKNFSISEVSLFFIIFILLIIIKSAPHVKNFDVFYKLKKDVTKLEKIDGNIETKLFKKGFKIKATNTSCPNICDEVKKSCDKKLCEVNYSFLQNRFTINGADVNFVSIILLSLIFLCVYNSKSKNLTLLIFYLLVGFLIIFLTKSRAGFLFFLLTLLMFSNFNFSIKKIFFIFLLSHLFLILLGYLMVNSVDDPMMMDSPVISKDGIINFPVASENETIELFRLFTIFDGSNFIRFSTYFQSFFIITNEFPDILFPDHSLKVADYNYITTNGSNLIIAREDYHPHNLLLGSIKEFGLISCLYFYYLVFSLFKHENFKKIFTPLIFSSIFLGVSVIFIIPTLLVFCFNTKNNFLNLLNKFKS